MNARLLAIPALLGLLLIVLPPAAHGATFENLPDGSIRHSFSGFVFPKQMGAFKRENTHQYNRAGSDISAGYRAGVLIVTDVYAYPAPAAQTAEVLSREYASKRAEVLHFSPGASVLSERPITISQGGKKCVGKRGYFFFRHVFAGKSQNLKSELLVFHDGPVFVEYRFTYLRDHAEVAEQEIDDFIKGWSWRGSPKS